jgi:hypothetical protein
MESVIDFLILGRVSQTREFSLPFYASTKIISVASMFFFGFGAISSFATLLSAVKLSSLKFIGGIIPRLFYSSSNNN